VIHARGRTHSPVTVWSMVSVDDQSERLSIFLNVFPNKVWYCIGAVASAFMISAVIMEWRRADSITSHIVFQSVGEHTP
jgi:hypothetical protein